MMFVAAVVVLASSKEFGYCFDICHSLGSTIKYIDISSKCMVGDGEVVAPDGR
jgi:hypothetical protein